LFYFSLGGKIPPAEKKEKTPESSSTTGGNKKAAFEEQQEEPEPELPVPELENTGIVEDKTGTDEYPMGDANKETTDEDMDKANEHRDLASAAFNEGFEWQQNYS
jgi:suppressor of tumorigenicity protein 13